MEGESILRELKTDKCLESLPTRATNYVAPLFHAERPPSEKTLSKLELFSLKLFKLSLERAKTSPKSAAPRPLINLCRLATSSLLVCAGASGKVPLLSFEKLLLHFAQLCQSCGDVDGVMETCQQLRGRLEVEGGREREDGGREGGEWKERDTLLKHAFDLAWKTALMVEQNSQNKKKDAAVVLDRCSSPGSSAELCLELREVAFSCLLTAQEKNKNTVFAVERILRSSQRYQKLVLGGNTRGTTAKSVLAQCFQRLHTFHTSLLSICDLPSSLLLLLPTPETFLSVDYLCVLAKISHKAGHTRQADQCLNRARKVCSGLDGGRTERGKGRKKKKTESAVQEEGDTHGELTSAHLALVQLTSALIDLSHTDNEEEGVSASLSATACEMERVTASDCLESCQSLRVWEYCEEVFACLEERRAAVKERGGQGREWSSAVIPREAFSSLLSLVTSHMKLAELRLDSKRMGVSEEQGVRTAQLSALNLVTQLLLSLLVHTEDEYPAIETPRSSTASPPLTPSPPPHFTHTHALAASCLPLLKSSRMVLRRASDGVLSENEHRWLGNSGYNLGLALFRADLVGEACDVLQVANEELRTWCEAGTGDKERAARWRESQLLKKTSLLVDCLRDSGRHSNVMETLVSTAQVLPVPLMCEGVEVMMEMWVRGKMELAAQQPDPTTFQQWRERTLLSLLPPAHPPLSTRHQAHILESEFTKCSEQNGNRSTNQLAVGRQLIDVYREGGREWDVERGRVMVAMATADSSILDEALELLEGVVSPTHHTLTPSHHHQALLHLATAHTLKALIVLQGRMGSCDMSSHDPVVESHDPDSESRDHREGATRPIDVCVSLSSEQRALLFSDEAESHLTSAVGRWCEWGGWEEGEEEMARVLHYLRLTAELCCVTRQFDLAVKSLGVLMNIYQWSPAPPLTATYQTALATYCHLGVRRGSCVADFPLETVEEKLLGAVREESGGRGRGRGGRGGSELHTSYLSCRLALASLYLHRGEIEKCRAELIALCRDPMLSRHSVSAHTLTAGTRITTALLLQTRHAPILPLKQFLTHLLTDHPSSSEDALPVCRLTSVELVSTAVKTLSSLTDHCGPATGTAKRNSREEGDLTSDPVSWGTVARLLDALHLLCRLHLRQGSVREALYYTREGVGLARKMALAAWYKEFLAVLSEIHSTKGDTLTAQTILSLSPPHPPIAAPFGCAELHAARKEAEAHLDLRQPSHALTVCREAIEKREKGGFVSCGVECDLALAWLHLTAGKAVIQEVAHLRPVLIEELWSQAESKPRRRGKAGGKKVVRVLGWLCLVPEPFQKSLAHLCMALQLCHPTCPAHLLREVYQWLSVLLSPYHLSLAAHCLLQSTHLSLSHHATTILGKRLHKRSHRDSKHPFHDVLITLQDSAEVCLESSNPLVQARTVLSPPTFPPPLSLTLSLISSLPEYCQFTVACLSPFISSQEDQEHLLLCVVGKNREPLFIKTLIEGQTILDEFSSTLSKSDESMRLCEKKLWWRTRRKLDSQMKEVVDGMQTKWLGDNTNIFVPPPPPPGGTTIYHLLCVGRLVQHLPWEAMPVLRGQAVARTPSLSFAVAHNILLTAQMRSVDPDRGYYVLNPRGDLPATQKRFHGWFEEELGWSGVVGHAPSSAQFSEALQSHDVFVYCGHGTGREFLSTDNVQLLCCQATTLLMGCGSGRLVVGGACDPAGMALTYLLAGCPSLVAVLWDVTDGDIDKLSKALLEHWLEGREGEEGREGGGVALSEALSAARSVCKLEGLNGYAAVVYGDPSIAIHR